VVATQERSQNPRTARVRRTILDAAAALLVEHGAAEVTALRIAQETGVARTTIYRHWPERTGLLLDTIDAMVAPHRPTTVTDDLEADLVAALANLRARMVTHPFRRIFAALLGQADLDDAFVAAQRRFVNGVLHPITDVLTAAVDRGDLSESVDVHDAGAVLAGPLFHRHVMLCAGIDDRLIDDTVRRFLASQR